jgi:hypothetical protein
MKNVNPMFFNPKRTSQVMEEYYPQQFKKNESELIIKIIYLGITF